MKNGKDFDFSKEHVALAKYFEGRGLNIIQSLGLCTGFLGWNAPEDKEKCDEYLRLTINGLNHFIEGFGEIKKNGK